VRELVLPEMERHGAIEAWIIDDTGAFPRRAAFGRGSAAILRRAWQAGQLSGRSDVGDRQSRCKLAGSLPEIVLAQIRWACEAGLLGADGRRLGVDTDLRMIIMTLGLNYVAGIQSYMMVWAPGTAPRPPKKWSGRGRPPKLMRRRLTCWQELGAHHPTSVKDLALRVAHRDYWRTDTRPEEWLLIEWPDGEKEPIKYWLSTLPGHIAFPQLVAIAKMRWRIERDYQELKQEVELGHFEGRGWRGFRLQQCDGNWWSLSSQLIAMPMLRCSNRNQEQASKLVAL
jgi:SRSO17 transposase